MDAAHQIISPSKLPKTTPILLAALAGLIWVLWQRYRAPKLIPQVAVVGGNSKKAIEHTRKQWKYHCMDLLVSGYLENRGQLYYAPSDRGERLMIPGRYLEELKAAPVEEVDFISTFIMMFDGKYTHVGSRDLMPPRVVRTLLNQNLPQVMPGVQDVVRDAFEARMPPCDDWTEVPMVDMINYVVARASSHMFGGYELSTNEKWLYTTLKFAEDVFYGSQKIKAFPELLKPAISPFVREIKAIKEHYRFAQELIQPILDRRRQTAAENNDLLHWLDSESEDHHKQSWFLSDIMLKLSFAALHTSASASVQLVFDLCAHPEYTPLLQREYSPFVDAEGRLDKVSLAKMPLMDSILRESMRINPLLLGKSHNYCISGYHDMIAEPSLLAPSHVRACHYAGLDPVGRYSHPQGYHNWVPCSCCW